MGREERFGGPRGVRVGGGIWVEPGNADFVLIASHSKEVGTKFFISQCNCVTEQGHWHRKPNQQQVFAAK